MTWDEAGPDNWTVLLHCPNCDVYREGVFTQDNVEELDEELDRGGDALARDYQRLLRANMGEEIRALHRRSYGGRDPARRLLEQAGLRRSAPPPHRPPTGAHGDARR